MNAETKAKSETEGMQAASTLAPKRRFRTFSRATSISAERLLAPIISPIQRRTKFKRSVHLSLQCPSQAALAYANS